MKHRAALFRGLLIIAVLVLVTLTDFVRVDAAAGKGQIAPNFKLVTLSGHPVTLESFRGRVLVVDFFSMWCHPCRESIPHLVEMNRKYAKQGLTVLGLSAEDDGEKAVRFFAGKNNISYPLALAEESVLADFGIRSVPVMFVIDKKGRVAEVFRGFSEQIAGSSEQLINRLLAEK